MTAFFLLLLAVLAAPARAQISVGVDAARRDYVLYEPIVVDVSLLNSSGKNIIFEADQKWLKLLVTREGVNLVSETGMSVVDKDIYLDSASLQKVRVNLTYSHEIREPGNYDVQATVRHLGRNYASGILHITVGTGSVQWKQRFVYLNPKTKSEEVRDYELVAQKGDRGNRLLARVRDPESRRIMCCTPLGPLLGFGEPAVKIDTGGTLHVLNQSGPRDYLYSKISPEGIREQPRYFIDAGSKPSLIQDKSEGILVVGGYEVESDGKTLLLAGDKNKPVPAIPVTEADMKKDKKKQEDDD